MTGLRAPNMLLTCFPKWSNVCSKSVRWVETPPAGALPSWRSGARGSAAFPRICPSSRSPGRVSGRDYARNAALPRAVARAGRARTPPRKAGSTWACHLDAGRDRPIPGPAGRRRRHRPRPPCRSGSIVEPGHRDAVADRRRVARVQLQRRRRSVAVDPILGAGTREVSGDRPKAVQAGSIPRTRFRAFQGAWVRPRLEYHSTTLGSRVRSQAIVTR